MEKFRKHIFRIIQIGSKEDTPSKVFDISIVILIFLNLFATLFQTFDESKPYTQVLQLIELITCIFFAVEYLLRLWTADFLYPSKRRKSSIFRFIFSFYGIIDLLTFFPYFLPFVFPAGAVAFRIFRVIRIFRLFKINAQYDAFNVITDVLNEKKMQLLSSLALILIMMVASSLCMYSLEYDAQPEVFSNAFSGIWWATSTLLTVGYGDIYPITIGGKIMAIVISFLGVGMVAIPTGIISAGFVEQYTKLKRNMIYGEERDLNFITSELSQNHPWCNDSIKSIVMPPELLLVMIIRKDEVIMPKGDVILLAKDILVFGAKNYADTKDINLKEMVIAKDNPWVGMKIKDLDFSRLDMIVMIKRANKAIIPNGSTTIHINDTVIMYSKSREEK